MSVVRAREAFSFTDRNGVPRVVRPGDVFDDADPDVAKRLHLFEPVQTAVDRTEVANSPTPPHPGAAPTVEATTAAPGEKRSVNPTTAKSGGARGPRGGGTAAS